MELLLIEIYEIETNQLVDKYCIMDIFSFPILMNSAWHNALCKNKVPTDANLKDYKFIIRED